ncbi:hypothetical protein Lal_00032799 [Lupinus albus]|nr:hypothetical protein Lal_00032799 [Lupinus albus]
MEVCGSTTTQCGRTSIRSGPYCSPAFQVERLQKFVIRKWTYIRYDKMDWMVEQGFKFPHQFEAQRTNTFLEMYGNIYLSLIRKFYSNFQYKDRKYVSVEKEKLIKLDDELFLNVGGLDSDGSPLGDCNKELWNSYDMVEMYKSCLRGPHYYVNTNLAQATVNDLKLMYAVKEGILVNWFAEILKVMFAIASS